MSREERNLCRQRFSGAHHPAATILLIIFPILFVAAGWLLDFFVTFVRALSLLCLILSNEPAQSSYK